MPIFVAFIGTSVYQTTSPIASLVKFLAALYVFVTNHIFNHFQGLSFFFLLPLPILLLKNADTLLKLLISSLALLELSLIVLRLPGELFSFLFDSFLEQFFDFLNLFVDIVGNEVVFRIVVDELSKVTEIGFKILLLLFVLIPNIDLLGLEILNLFV